ncbi:MAG: T9SS type A sorting domain-containing protein, partial [Bacteroidota bacterium]
IQIDKTVFAGHDSGASCPGGELVQAANGSDVTYCFTVTNTGSTFLDDITISDPALSLIRADLTLLSGTEPLAPGASLVFFFETTLTGDLTNTATTGGNPVDSNGNDLPAVPEPSDDDTAVVEDAAPRINLSKTVFAGHDSGASCPGGELVTDTNGANITYCFAVKNTGTTFLNNVALTDADLGIDRSDLTLLSGTEPLAPNASLVFFFETTISGDLVNTASTSANPTDANGNDIPNLQDPTDTDTAEVREQADKIDLEVAKTVDMPAPDEGDQVTFTVSVVNNGPAVATGVEVTDTLPAGLGFISTNGGSQGSVSGTGPAIVWTVGTLGVNETATLEITVSVDAVGTFVNEAEVTAADQDDVDSTPNDGQGDDFARASVTSSDSSGGGAAGVESDGNMASKLATRLFERRQDAMARKALRAAPSPVILTTSSASARLSASKTTSLDLSEIVPEEGPQQSQAFVTTPRELLGVTNATSVFAVDYLRVDSRRLGAIFGATSPAGTLYDHTKNICDRLGGGRLQGVQQLAVGDQPFILSELVLADGQADYAVSFVAYRTGNSYVIDSRFTPDEYDVPVGTEEVINLQVWSVAPSYTADMVADVIDQFRAKGDVTFINTWEAAPTVPQVYIHSGEYANGVLTLRVFNGGDATTVEVEGTTSLTESNAANQVRDAFRTTVSVPQATEPGALVEVEVEVGYLFDAAFSIREVGTESVDRVYYSDGAWGISTPSDATVRTFEVYADEGTPTETTDYLVGRDAYLGGQVTTWASLFRYLRPAGQPIDLSAYDAIEFTAYGQGRISMLLEKASIETWDQFGTNFVLGTEPRSYRIAFDDLQLANGGGTFSANDVTSIVFYAQGSNGVASNFDLVVEDVRFTGNRSVDIEDPTDTLPTTITLGQNYPNPFNPTTTIPFTLSQQTDVRLAVYDVLGREVQVLVDGLWSAGSHTAVFEAGNLPSGTYLYRLEANGQTFGQTLVLMK